MMYWDRYKPKPWLLEAPPRFRDTRDLSDQEKSPALAVQNKSHRRMSTSGCVGRLMENSDVFLGWEFGIVSLHKGASVI